jgi:hypothetical protein
LESVKASKPRVLPHSTTCSTVQVLGGAVSEPIDCFTTRLDRGDWSTVVALVLPGPVPVRLCGRDEVEATDRGVVGGKVGCGESMVTGLRVCRVSTCCSGSRAGESRADCSCGTGGTAGERLEALDLRVESASETPADVAVAALNRLGRPIGAESESSIDLRPSEVVDRFGETPFRNAAASLDLG